LRLLRVFSPSAFANMRLQPTTCGDDVELRLMIMLPNSEQARPLPRPSGKWSSDISRIGSHRPDKIPTAIRDTSLAVWLETFRALPAVGLDKAAKIKIKL